MEKIVNSKIPLHVFPKDFRWGTATAAYQIEGAYNEDGRGPSIWDVFSETPGKVLNGDTGKVAVDHYHRFKDDIRMMKELGIHHYRFSLAWPRLFSDGKGSLNEKGADFYHRLIDELLSHDIQPAVTLYHWDLPQALQETGGWQNRATAYHFQEFAESAFKLYGDRVKSWITHNEPWCSAYLGHFVGIHAPGIQDPQAALKAAHHILYSHGLALEAGRQLAPDANIGITLNLNPIYPETPGSKDEMSVNLHDVVANRWFLDPVFKGKYPVELAQIFGDLPEEIKEEDLKTISQPIDFLGVNYYSYAVIRFDESEKVMLGKHVTPTDRITDMGWPVNAKGLRDLLVRLQQDYHPKAIMVTENGAAYPDVVENGKVLDEERIDYVSEHIEAIGESIQHGVNVKGYYLWSFMDNYEWQFGYSKRFGIVYVDYRTLARIPKESAHWYTHLIHDFEDINKQ